MLHVLVFLLRSVVDPCKFSLENFLNTGAIPSQMFALLWKAFSSCERNSLKALTVKCDGASPNCKCFHMHFPTTKENYMNHNTGVTYLKISLRSRNFLPKLVVSHK